MVSRGVFYIVTAILFVIGIALMLYQHIVFEIPFLPGQQRTVWSVEAKVEFEPIESNAVTVNLALPGVQPGFSQIKQNTSSIGFGTSYITKRITQLTYNGPNVILSAYRLFITKLTF